ncbi:MAG: helix-turn-helix transcriptional regulator [Bacteroidota bacterium]
MQLGKKEQNLPEVHFEGHSSLNIEVMNFEQLFDMLNEAQDHDPFAPHKIEFFLILTVTKHTYTHFIDFTSYELTEGSTLFVAKNQVHYFDRRLQDADGYGIVFNHLFVNQHYFLTDNLRLNRLFNYHIESPVIHQKEMGGDSLIEQITFLHEEHYLENTFAKSEILASLLRVVLLKAERAKQLQALSHINSYWLETFGNFKETLEREYANTRNSRFYASQLFVSYKFLNDVVKRLSGKTVKAFIDDFVIIEIKRNLISTSLSVNEISYLTGFEEPSNMIKFFKKHTQTTPLRFRQQL